MGETIVVSKATENGEQATVTVIRRSSNSEGVRRPSFGSALAPMTPIHTLDSSKPLDKLSSEQRGSFSDSVQKPRRPFAGLAMTPVTDSPAEPSPDYNNEDKLIRKGYLSKGNPGPHSTSAIESDDEEGAEKLIANSQLSQLHISASNPLSSPRELAAQIHPALSALRSPSLVSALNVTGASVSIKQENASGSKQSINISMISPPLLMPDSKCSGYFVEPVRSTFIT